MGFAALAYRAWCNSVSAAGTSLLQLRVKTHVLKTQPKRKATTRKRNERALMPIRPTPTRTRVGVAQRFHPGRDRKGVPGCRERGYKATQRRSTAGAILGVALAALRRKATLSQKGNKTQEPVARHRGASPRSAPRPPRLSGTARGAVAGRCSPWARTRGELRKTPGWGDPRSPPPSGKPAPASPRV